MKHKNILLLAIMVLVLTCVGCGQQSPKDNSDTVPPTQAENSIPDENPSDGNKLFEISNLEGTVTEFSEDGCKLSPSIESGDHTLTSAAPGYEDKIVSVSYNSDCTFQVAHLDYQTSAATYEPATVEDVKKQTSLIICGEYDENDVLHASRVFIYRIEGM